MCRNMAVPTIIWAALIFSVVNISYAQAAECPNVEGETEGNILIPHETDCSKFYQCSFGVKVEHQCPESLHFNAATKQCDWPDNAKCNQTLLPDKRNKEKEEIPKECPQVSVDPEDDILIPHETHCDKFYKCSFGQKYEIDCPDGLFYNPEKRWCDWPRNVDCANDNSTNKCPKVEKNPEIDILLPHEWDCTKFYKCDLGNKKGMTCPNDLHFSVTAQGCDWPDLANCTYKDRPANECPQVEDDPDDDILIPHESNCAKFYKCSFGDKIVQDCPHGLYYNAEMKYCDWPENVNCNGTSNDSQEDEKEGPGQCPQVNENPKVDIILSHESDCSKFYICDLGKKVEFNCPAGLHYNPKVRQCDWPRNVDCGRNATNTCPKVEENPKIDILLPHESDCTKFYKCDLGEKVLFTCPASLHFSVETQNCQWPDVANCKVTGEPENECPQVEEDPDDDILLPHKSDCSKFYKCSFGVKVEMDCPSGLHYNPKTKYCDWPDNAECEESDKTELNKIVMHLSGSSKNTCPIVEEDPEDDILFPHETDCNKFYKCSMGHKVVQVCQEGLHFNAEQCDWPENAGCQK